MIRVVASGNQPLVHLVATALREAFPDLPLSNADARRVVVAGATRVNGRTVTRPGLLLEAGDRVSVTADPTKLARSRRQAAASIAILYDDPHSMPARPGVVVFGRTAAANKGLAHAFAQHDVEKVYLAIVEAHRRPDLTVGRAWTARGSLAQAGSGRRGRRVAVSDTGQPAETAFLVRARRGDRVLLEARPKTGRQHQIRAHLAAEQAPIVGDARYGGSPAARLHLHAWRIMMPHPVSAEPLRIEAPPPEGWLSSV